MEANSSSREARRKRIVDRGTYRLALITGRIQSLPDPPPPPPYSNPHPVPPSSDRNVVVENFSSSEPEITRVEESHISKNHSETVPQSHNPVPKTKSHTQSLENVLSESFDRPESSVSRTAQFSQLQTLKRKVPFTPRQITSAVTESESLRNFCSLFIAFMVVLSYAGFPILRSSLFKNVVFFRPLILLLLTNITIVVAPLLKEQQRGRERLVRESDESSAEGPGMAEQLGNALEIGMLMQKVLGALFMDCSIYSVIVVSGMSLFQ